MKLLSNEHFQNYKRKMRSKKTTCMNARHLLSSKSFVCKSSLIPIAAGMSELLPLAVEVNGGGTSSLGCLMLPFILSL